jgi:hypothetical protein
MTTFSTESSSTSSNADNSGGSWWPFGSSS